MSQIQTPKIETPPEPAHANSEPQDVRKFIRQEASDPGLTTIFGGGYGQYQVRPQNFLLSLASHTVALGLLIWLFHITIQPKILPGITANAIPLTDYTFKVGKGGQSGGGGGEASKLKASRGTPPKAAQEQFTPPVVLQQQKSKLMVTPTVVADARIPQSSQMGDPLSKLMIPSSGTGITAGIGSGDGGGVGSGHGGPGVGAGFFTPGIDGVSKPTAIYTPEPEFSEEARKAKYQGAVMIDAIIGTDGRVHNARIVRSLGMGLDEKAMEIVRLWKFDPGKKDGRPVPVQMGLEIDFNLY